MFRGSLVALLTPFDGSRIDEPALRRLVDWHIAEGTHGLVPVGTTGERLTMSIVGLLKSWLSKPQAGCL